jgi:molecular chaperone GrpE
MHENEQQRPEKADRESDLSGRDEIDDVTDAREHPSPASETTAEAPDEPSIETDDAKSRSGDEVHQQPDDGGEAARLREAMLRMKAEMDNREKRLEREMTKSRKFAVERLVRDLIPVLDSMDQALASEPASEGMELTRKQALKVLSEHGLEALDPLGERFDPTWHEAIATQPSESDPDDTVLQVLQKGYRLNERLVRPARVIVAKAP